MSTVSPPGSVVFGSAPAFSSIVTMDSLPLTQASESGATPYRFTAAARARAASSRRTVPG